jgi:hypothetical protein
MPTAPFGDIRNRSLQSCHKQGFAANSLCQNRLAAGRQNDSIEGGAIARFDAQVLIPVIERDVAE